jgi:hypothetical protein
MVLKGALFFKTNYFSMHRMNGPSFARGGHQLIAYIYQFRAVS